MEVDKGAVENQGMKKKRGERKTATAAGAEKKKMKKKKKDDASVMVTTSTTTTSSDSLGFRVSVFDNSAENHFRAMDMMYKLCGEEEDDGGFDDDEFERISSTITFLSEWRYFNYKPRIIRFVSEPGVPNKQVRNEISLSQFSAAMVPKCDTEEKEVPGGVVSSESRKDFVLYVGGLVWALDWCPRPDQETNSDTTCEFIAVAAHPPDSMYHKLGEPLHGRGMIQIWCLVNSSPKEDKQAPLGKAKPKVKKNAVATKNDNKPKRPRGRPRKNAISPAGADPEGELTQALVVRLPENTSDLPLCENILNTPASPNVPASAGITKENSEKIAGSKEESKPRKSRGRPKKNAIDRAPDAIDSENQYTQALVVRLPENVSDVPPMDSGILRGPSSQKEKGKKRKVNRKNTVDETADIPDFEEPFIEALAVEFPEDIPNVFPTEDDVQSTPGSRENKGKKRKSPTNRPLATDFECTISMLRKRLKKKSKVRKDPGCDSSLLPIQNEEEGPSHAIPKENCSGKDNTASEGNVAGDCLLDFGYTGDHVPKDVLPRVVLCLGHDGKVAWDVKWRPCNVRESWNRHRMGYLAVVLGNGSIEVWEIPSPRIAKYVYASRHGDTTDPRFAKLKPVFKSSILKYGDRQSMPLTVEWSAAPPHDLILAGCHDGVVALWKFSTDGSSEDVRPLLCFRAETVPIRALSWAPFDGDPESKNVIVTAGHGGLKFWDLRDPFRPLWEAMSSQRYIYGLDWLPDPRCVIASYDDGTMRILGLSKAAYDVPVTGEPFAGTLQQGLHSYYCSSFAIWSVHVSRLTGMVAYCSADGTVLYFQLTHKAVEKDPSRNRVPHFLCGSLTDEKSAVAVNTELPTSPHLMKKSATEWANTPRAARTVISGLNQAKRARKGVEKSQQPDDQVPVLCYGDDPGNGDTNEAERITKTGKGRTSKWKTTNANQAFVCNNNEGEGEGNTNGVKADGKEETDGEVEVPPSKIVSMYKVRWNMNKGSARWLCYGGAAGIVRCQEIVAPVFDKKLLKF